MWKNELIPLDGWCSCAHCTQRMALGLPRQYSAQIKRVMFGIIRSIISRIKMSQAFVVILNSGSAGIASKTTSENSQIDRIVDSNFVRSPSRSRKLYFAQVCLHDPGWRTSGCTGLYWSLLSMSHSGLGAEKWQACRPHFPMIPPGKSPPCRIESQLLESPRWLTQFFHLTGIGVSVMM